MNITREQLKLYAVTDRSWLGSETLYEQVEKALKGGVTLVQLREKTLDEAAFVKEGQELLELCHHYNVPLIINDNVKLAKKIHADGIDRQIGRSMHAQEKDPLESQFIKGINQSFQVIISRFNGDIHRTLSDRGWPRHEKMED